MTDDDFCNDADEWKQIADSYASELEHRDDRIDALQVRIKKLEAVLQEIADDENWSLGGTWVGRPGDFMGITEVARAALEGKKDD